MYGESDSDSYAPSWAGSDYTPLVARSRRRKQNQKMLVEVVIPIPNSSKRKASSPAWSPRNPSPTRSESSISLGTNWHRSPRKKRRRQRKRTDTVIEESTEPRRKRGRPRKQVADGPTPSVHFQPSQSAAESTATSRPRPSTITVDLSSARLDNIQAQERSRGYQHLFTPPSSGDTQSPDLKERVARGSPLSRTGSRLYALDAGQAGSSTGPGTQEWAKARGTANEFPSSQRETRSSTLAASSQVPGYRSAYSQPRDMSATPKQEHTTAGSPVKGQDLGRLPQVAFADPDYDLWAQIGLRVTFERMVEEYGFSMDMVQKVYDSRGSVEDTEQFLIKMKNMMTDAMHNPEIYKSAIAGPLDHVTSDVAKAFVFIYAPRLAAVLLDHDASAYNSEAVPVLSIPRSIDRDPLFIAKRKILLSKEGALDTSHSAIKKNVPWSDLSKGIEDGPPNKRVRLSQSTSITPGIPEILKDTPTPASQSSIHSAIKASRAIKGFASIKPSRPSLTVVSPGGSRGKPRQYQSAPRVTIRSPPSARKAQTQPPEVIDLVSASEEVPPERHPSAVSASAVDDEPDATAGQSLPRPSSPPPISNSEAYDVGSHQGQDVYDPNEWLNRHTSPARAATLPPRSTATQTPSRAPSFASYLNDFARPEQSVPRSTPFIESTQSTAPTKASRKRKRETSEMGIQTLRADQVDWLEGLEIDDSMTDIDVSRVWVEHVSPKKRRAEDVPPNGELEDHEEEEAPIGNFLDRLKEGLARRDEEQEWEQEQESPVEAPVNQEDHVEEHYEGGNEQSLEQALEADETPNHPNESENVEAQDEPVVVSTVSKPASTSPLKPEPRRISTSQPVANAFAPRSGSRLYTPQPEPTSKHRQELRAAPTLGRSLLGDNVQPQPIPARVALGAAPTLGRSAEFSPELLKSSKSKGKSAQARSPRHPSARSSSAAVADHDVEHVSAPDVPVNPPGTTSKQPAPRGHTPILISSSPTHRNWELEPTRTSTPQRFQTRMSPSVSEPVHDEALEDEPIPSTGKHRPSLVPLPTSTPSLAALDKRRRSSLAPLSRQSSLGAKKIRRDYDTTGSSAAPRVRAHKDTYDEFGDRIWVPSRPKMKRASDEAIAKFANDDSRIISHEIEQEDTREEEEDEQDHNEQDRTRAKATPAFTTTSTEIPETPQVPRSHNLFDISSELRGTSGVRMQSSPPAPPVVAEAPQPAAMAVEPRVDPAPVPIVAPVPVVPVSVSPSPARPRPTASPSPSQPAVGSSPPEASAARVTPITTARDATLPLSSPVVKLDNKSYQQQPSKLRPQRHSLQTTPALRPVWSSARTRLSIGPAGFTLLHASGYDKDELAKAGLEPMMQRLADKHGFNVNLVASLFQETGSLKETEESLARMQRSVEKTRAEIRRESFRKVGVDLLHGEEIPLDSSPNGDGADAEDGEDFRDWDTSRTRSRLLFGD